MQSGLSWNQTSSVERGEASAIARRSGRECDRAHDRRTTSRCTSIGKWDARRAARPAVWSRRRMASPAKDAPMPKIAIQLLTATLLALSAGCKTVPVDQRAALRDEILRSSEETKSFFVKENPSLEQELAAAAGYFTARISGGKVVIGGANGIGVLVDNASSSRTFMNATRVDVGVALGAGTERILAILETREAFEKFRRGM